MVRTDDCILLHYCISEQQYLLPGKPCKSLDGVSTVDHDVDNAAVRIGSWAVRRVVQGARQMQECMQWRGKGILLGPWVSSTA